MIEQPSSVPTSEEIQKATEAARNNVTVLEAESVRLDRLIGSQKRELIAQEGAKKDIEDLIELAEGKLTILESEIESFKGLLEELKTKSSPICHIYQPLSVVDSSSGKCSDYIYRGLICRLFGYGANRDKFGEMRLATCKIIKEGQAENYEAAKKAMSEGLYVPIFTDYYMNLSQIDFRLGNVILPINKALRQAIEEVLQYYAYRPFPKGFKNCA